MAGSTQKFTLQIDADISRAKKNVSELQKYLNAIQDQGSFDAGMTKELQESAEAARILQRELQKATDVNTGKLDASQFAKGLTQAGTSVSELSTKLLNAGTTGQQAFMRLSQSIATADVPIRKMNASLQNMLTSLKNTVKWEISSNIVHGLEGALSGAVSYAKNLNTSLTNIRIVTGQSVDDMARFAEQANKAAKTLSTTTRAYADASLIYYQQGDSAEEAAKKAAITIKAANASFGTSAEQMSEYLTAVWNSYQVGSDELEHYVDIMASLGAKTATSLEEIATSMQKVAATANTVGVSMEQVSSIIATVSSVTRESAESIGTSYKTIFARIGDLKLGETLEDGVSLGQVSSQLKTIGVNVLDAKGNMRDMGAIIEDLGNRWQSLSRAEQTATAQVVAGKRQYTQLMALFSNWDQYQSNLNIAENSDGSLQRMADIYAESWEAASKKVQASLEGVYGKILNDQSMIQLTQSLSGFIDGIGDVIDGLGGVKGVLASLGSLATTVFQSQMTKAFNNMGQKVASFVSSFKGMNKFAGFKSILKGESIGQREYKKLLEQTSTEAATWNSGSQKGSNEEARWENVQKLIGAKQQLLLVEKNLTDAERQQAGEAISVAAEQLTKIEENTQAYNSQKTVIQNLKRELTQMNQSSEKNTIGESWNKKEGQSQKTVGEQIFNPTAQAGNSNVNIFSKSLNQDSGLDSLVQRMVSLRQATTAFGDAALGAGNSLQEFNQDGTNTAQVVSGLDNKLDTLRMGLTDTGVDTSFIDKLQKDIHEAANSGNTDTLKQKIQELQIALGNMQSASGTAATQAFEFLSQKAGLSEAKLSELAQQGDETARILLELGRASHQAGRDLSQIDLGEKKFGKAMSKIVQSIAAGIAGFEQMSNLVQNFEDMNLTSQVSSIGGLVTNSIGQLASGNIAGFVTSLIGTGIGYVVGKQEKKLKDSLERREKNAAAASEAVQNNIAETQSLKELTTSFSSLLEQKKQGLDVDKQLQSTATELATKYGLTGVAVANLTGDYDQLILRLQKIATGDYTNVKGPMNLESAKNNYQTAYEGMSGENSIFVSNKYTNMSASNSPIKISEKQELLKFQKLLSDMGVGYEDNSTGGNGRQGTTSIKVPTIEFDIKTTDKLDNTELTYQELINQANASWTKYFTIDDGKWYELIYGNNKTSAEYRIGMYEALEDLIKQMDSIGVSQDYDFYKGIVKIVNTLKPQYETYKQAKEAFTDAIIQTESMRYIGKSAGENNYNFEDFYSEQQQSVAAFVQAGLLNDPNANEQELTKLARISATQAAQIVPGLSPYTLALEAAREIFGDEQQAASTLIDLESQGVDLSQIDAQLLQVYKASGGNSGYLTSIIDRSKASSNFKNSFEQYQKTEDISSLVKEVMGYDDIKAIMDVVNFGENGIISAEEFFNMSYDNKVKYLESIQEANFNATLQAARDVAAKAKTEADQAEGQVTEFLQGSGFEEDQIKEAIRLRDANNAFWTDLSRKVSYNDESKMYVANKGISLSGQELSWLAAYNTGKANGIIKDETFQDYANRKMQENNSRSFNGISADIIQSYEALVAQAEESGRILDDADKEVLMLEAIAKSAENAAASFEQLTKAIKDVPTDGKELQKVAEGLGMSVLGYIHASPEDRLAALESKHKRERPVLQATGKDVDPDTGTVLGIYSTDEDVAEYRAKLAEWRQDGAQIADLKLELISDDQAKNAQELTHALSALNDLDIDKMPARGTKAYEALANAFKLAGKDIDDFNKAATKAEKIDYLKLAKQALIKEQVKQNQELQNAYQTQIDSGNLSNEKKLEYEMALNDLKQEEIDLTNQQAEADRQAAEAKRAYYEEELNYIKNRKAAAEEEANKTKEVAEIMTAAIQTGELSEEDKARMNAVNPNLVAQWNSAADATARGALAMQYWSDFANQSASAGAELAQTYNDAADSLQNIHDTQTQYEWDKNNFNEDIFMDVLAKQGMSADQLGLVGEVIDELSKTQDLSTLDYGKVIDLVVAELRANGKEVSDEWAIIGAQCRDRMKEAAEQMAQDQIEAAKKAADAWLEAFKTIADARQKLIQGESLMSEIAGDPQKFMQYYQSYLKNNPEATPQEFFNEMKSGTLKAQDLAFANSQELIDAQKEAMGLNLEGFGTRGQQTDKGAIARDMFNGKAYSELNKEEKQVVDAAQKAKYAQIALSGGIVNDQGAADDWAQSIINGDIEYSELQGLVNQLVPGIEFSTQALTEQTKISEITGERDAKIDQQNEQREEHVRLGSTAFELANRDSDTDILDILTSQGMSEEDFLKAFYHTDDVTGKSIADIDEESLNSFYLGQQRRAHEQAVLANIAAISARDQIEQEGYGKDSQEWKNANSVVEETQRILNEAENARKGAMNDIIEASAQSVNMSFEEFSDFMVSMQQKTGRELNTDQQKQAMIEYCQQVLLTQNAMEELRNVSDETWDSLKNDSQTGSKEYSKNMTNMRKIMKQIFGKQNGDLIYTDDFIKENLDNLHKLTTGTEEEIAEAYDAIEDNIISAKEKAGLLFEKDIKTPVTIDDQSFDSITDIFQNFFDQWDGEEIGFTLTANGSGVIKTFNSLLEAGNMSVEQLNGALADIGWSPEIEWVKADATNEASQYIHGGYYLVDGSYVPVDSGVKDKYDQTVYFPRIKSASKTKKTPPTSGKKGGGGGGGGKKETKKLIRNKDEIKRYHNIQEQLSRTKESLDQIASLKERAYGKKYIDLLDQETQKLKENVAEQQQYRSEIASWLQVDRQAVAALGGQFDLEGNISNYEQLMMSLIDQYNAAITRYNESAQSEGDKLALEDAEERFEEAKKEIEQYEETLKLTSDSYKELLDLENQLSELALEKITYKIEVITELNEGDLEILQHFQDTYEDQLDRQGDLMRNLTQQAKEYESNILVLNSAMNELQQKFAAGEINEQHFKEGMDELRSQTIDLAGELESLKDEVLEVYTGALDLASEEMAKYTDVMQDAAEAMDSYIQLTELLGRGTNYRELEKFYDVQFVANKANLEAQRAYVDTLQEQEDYFKRLEEEHGTLTATEQEQYQALQEALREANNELTSSTQSALENLRSAYENTINAIFKELDEAIAGTAGTLADLADKYAYYQEEQERYVSTARELHDISKLNRDIEKSLEDATNNASKAKLRQLQDEINLISEKNDLSEYDIEMMELQYQLLLAQIALEEAQATKDTVRLTRDEDGNMAYQYTADAQKVHEAQQQYEDVLQQINELAANRVSELEQQCLQAEQQYLQSAQEILLDTTLTDEQRTARLEELSRRYSETLLYIQEQYNNASSALSQNQQTVAEHYGQALVNSAGVASSQMNDLMAQMIANAEQHILLFDQAISGEGSEAWQEYIGNVKTLSEASRLTYDDLIANSEHYQKASEDANAAVKNMIDYIRDSLTDVNDATTAWDSHAEVLDAVQKRYEAIALAAQSAATAVSGFTAQEGASMFAGELSLGANTRQEVMDVLNTQLNSMYATRNDTYHAGAGGFGDLTDFSGIIQNIEINADFPNVVDSEQIKLAFDDLINLATQHAYSSDAVQKQ